ncbi:MAG: hypothetical protein ACFB2X_02015 [Rivularia sp. (in: cyanobacteria)]
MNMPENSAFLCLEKLFMRGNPQNRTFGWALPLRPSGLTTNYSKILSCKLKS